MSNEHKVVGYFADLSPQQVICTPPDACLITGSEEAMKRHVAEVDKGMKPSLRIGG